MSVPFPVLAGFLAAFFFMYQNKYLKFSSYASSEITYFFVTNPCDTIWFVERS